MSKVLIDRELLERVLEYIPSHGTDPISGVERVEPEEVQIHAILAQPAEAEGMSGKHEISCWKCHEMTSLETRNEMDGCCWACGEEIDLDDYLIKAMDKRDEHYAALSSVSAERDAACEQKAEWVKRASELGDSLDTVTAERDRLDADCGRLLEGKIQDAETIFVLEAERDQLRAEFEALWKDAERYRWLAKRDRWASLLVDFDRNSTYRRHRVVFFAGDDWPQFEGQTIDEAVDAAMAAKEGV